MISLLSPTRKRPKQLARMIESVRKTAKNHVEIVCYIDDDDYSYPLEVLREIDMIVVGPRIRAITDAWNKCFDSCAGDIVCQNNDDTVWNTPGWDVMVEKAFAEVPDKILVVHGRDVFGHGDRFGPHAFVHRKWVETLGFFIYPYYTSDFGDAGLNELADRIGRRRFVPFDIEHHHFSYGLCEPDENTLERLARHKEDDPDSIYYSPEKMQERAEHALKLAAVMTSDPDTSKWVPPGTPGRLSMGKCPKCGSLSTVPAAQGSIHCNACGFLYVRMGTPQ